MTGWSEEEENANDSKRWFPVTTSHNHATHRCRSSYRWHSQIKMHKMYLISPEQIKHLHETHGNASRTNIREKAEADLDNEMRRVLETEGLNLDEKIKRYNMLLQKYLVLEKQKLDESKQITLRLPAEREGRLSDRSYDRRQYQEEESEEGEQQEGVNIVLHEVLTNINPRSKRNTACVEY